MTHLQSPCPQKLQHCHSQFQFSYFALNPPTSPTKLSSYIKDRSVSRCRELVRMMSVDSSSKLNMTGSSAVRKERNANIEALADEIIQEMILIKAEARKELDESQLGETQSTLRKCLNLLKEVKEEEVRPVTLNDGKSFLEIQIEGILRSDNQRQPYRRQKRKFNQMALVRSLDRCSIKNMDTVVENMGEAGKSADRKVVARGIGTKEEKNQ